MQRITLFSIIIWIIICGATIFAMRIGAQSPLPPQVARLHFDQCALPCWIGITPGIATLSDAQQHLVKTFPAIGLPSNASQSSQPNPGAMTLDALIPLTLDSSGNGINIFMSSFYQMQSIYWLSLTPIQNQPTAGADIMPSVGDVVHAYGAPTCYLKVFGAVTHPSSLVYANGEGKMLMAVGVDTPINWSSPVLYMQFQNPTVNNIFTCPTGASLNWRKTQWDQ